jgi:DUF971 family protein
MRPVNIELISREVLTIGWDDGHQSIYFIRDLRKACPCAVCRDKDKSDNPLQIVPLGGDNVELADWEMVGRYAVSFRWSDGHNDGIYPYAMLRELCQCDECQK